MSSLKNSLLSYVSFFRDRSTANALRKVVLNFYSPSEISEAKKVLINTFQSVLDGCAFKAERCKSVTRSAHDVKVEDIDKVLNYLDTSSVLSRVEFAIGSLNRLPGLYEPEDINICTVVDRQVKLDAIITDLSVTMAAFTAGDSSASSVLGGVTAAVEKLNERLHVVTGGMQDQLNQLATTCGKLAENIIRTPDVNDVRAPSGDDRAMNVIISGIAQDKSSSVWRDVLLRVLYTAASKDIVIEDAFCLGRYGAGKTRPLLVKLHSAWDRRLVLGGACKLNEVDEFKRRIYIAADELLEARRRTTLDRLKRRGNEKARARSSMTEFSCRWYYCIWFYEEGYRGWYK